LDKGSDETETVYSKLGSNGGNKINFPGGIVSDSYKLYWGNTKDGLTTGSII